MSDRDEARRRREEARSRRRETAETPESAGDTTSPTEESPSDSHGGLAQAVKVAAAAAAVGAAAGAARAIAERDGRDDDGSDQPVFDEQPEARRPDDEADEVEPRAEAREDESDADGEAAAHEELESPQPEAAHDEPLRAHEPVAGGSLQETTEVVDRARGQLTALRGREPESVSALERTHDGWTVTFEVVELERVPDSTDVLASYEVLLDENLNVTRYARVRRYSRSQADGGEGS